MKAKLQNIKRNFHLLLTGIAFFILFLVFLSDSIEYFWRDRFYEGYMVFGSIVVFDFFSLFLIIPYIVKKDFKRFGIAAMAYVLTTLIGLLGFKIPLIILPFLTLGSAIFFIVISITLNRDEE